ETRECVPVLIPADSVQLCKALPDIRSRIGGLDLCDGRFAKVGNGKRAMNRIKVAGRLSHCLREATPQVNPLGNLVQSVTGQVAKKSEIKPVIVLKSS